MKKMTAKAELRLQQKAIVTSLSDSDLLGLVLRDKNLGMKIGCCGLHNISEDIVGVHGRNKIRVSALVELIGRLGFMQLEKGSPFRCSADIFDAYKPRMANLKQEIVMALALDSKNCVIAEHEIVKGTLNEAQLGPREFFRPLIKDSAARAVVIHNHPSGDPTPSPQDYALNQRLCKAGELLGIALLDFIIVGSQGCTSFRDTGLMRVEAA